MNTADPLTTRQPAGLEPPKVKGGHPFIGHMIPFARNPYRFMKHVSDTVGEIAQFKIFNQRMILLTGDDASKVFYRSSDEQLDQSAAYKLMTPIFGEGIIFDAPNDIKNQQLKMLMPALRMEAMREHSHKIVKEVEDMIARWGDSGEVELVSAMKELTINTASHCLLGREFRYELTREFADIYHDLEKGVNPLAYSFPDFPLPAFRKRDRARKRLHTLVGNIVTKRQQQKEKPTDMFQMLIDTRYDDGTALTTNEITGMLTGAIFAGHHTSSGTSAWVLLELLKHPHVMRQVRDELEQQLGTDGQVTFQNMREIPRLENVLKEVLRLHPPLIVLMRQVSQPLRFKDYTINVGDMVWASPPVTHRMSRLFPNPEVFDPDRYLPDRSEDKNLMAYQPFGGGKHKCSGNAFAMFQIKAIFSILLRHFDFELVDSPDTYQDDYTQMIVQPRSPCKVRYRRRAASTSVGQRENVTTQPSTTSGCPVAHHATTAERIPTNDKFRIVVDRQLCQGHSMCMGEAPALFRVDEGGNLSLLNEQPDLALLEKARQAAAFCPNHAIKIETD